MDRTTPLGGHASDADALNPPSSPKLKPENAAQTAHRTVDSIADKSTAQIDRISGSAHRAVDAATEWASGIPEQAKEAQVRLTEAACTSIRARPLSTVVGALIVGYLIGRIARS
jgi:ElaB/YqjD/DUF883 family membrane-anchored ribosome-binding protein